MPSEPVRYRAVVDLYLGGKNGETHIAPGELLPKDFKIPDYWITDGRVEPA